MVLFRWANISGRLVRSSSFILRRQQSKKNKTVTCIRCVFIDWWDFSGPNSTLGRTEKGESCSSVRNKLHIPCLNKLYSITVIRMLQ